MLSPLSVGPILRKKCLCAQCISNTTRVCLKALEKHFFLLQPVPVKKTLNKKAGTRVTYEFGHSVVVFFSKNGLMNDWIAHHLQHCQVMYGITLQDFWALTKPKIISGDGQTPLGGRDK